MSVPRDVTDTTHRWTPNSGVMPMMVVDVEPVGKSSIPLTF